MFEFFASLIVGLVGRRSQPQAGRLLVWVTPAAVAV